MKNTPASLNQRLRASLRFIPGFPDSRYNFPDITPLLERDPALFRDVIAELLRETALWDFDTVLCVESFGYIFGVPIALERGLRIALMRRPGKLPRETISESYSMCYDPHRMMEVHVDAIEPGARVLAVDDFMISGGTFDAAFRLITRCGGHAIGAACVVENPAWRARDRLAHYSIPIVALAAI